MFIVIENRVYASAKNASNKYPLVSISIDEDGVVTITDEGEGIATLPAMYKKMTLEEVIATFSITADVDGGYKPFVDLDGYDPVTIYLDESNKVVTITAANPSAGVFTGTSSNTDVATVTNSNGAFTIVPVAEGVCDITVKFEPTDTDFADTYCKIPVTVAKRKVVLEQQRDIQMVKSTTGSPSTATAVIKANVASPTIVANSSDEDNIEVSVSNQTITFTAAEDKTGGAIIKVYGTKTGADDSADIEFKVHAYATASAAVGAAPADFDVDSGEEVELEWTLPSGGKIVEAVSSDDTHIEVLAITADNKVKVKGVATTNNDQAVITAYYQQRSKGQVASTVTGTVKVS